MSPRGEDYRRLHAIRRQKYNRQQARRRTLSEIRTLVIETFAFLFIVFVVVLVLSLDGIK